MVATDSNSNAQRSIVLVLRPVSGIVGPRDVHETFQAETETRPRSRR